MNKTIEDRVEEFARYYGHDELVSVEDKEHEHGIDYLRTALTEVFEQGRDIGMKADNVLRKEGYYKALEDVRVLIARHAKDDIDVPALVEDINNLKL